MVKHQQWLRPVVLAAAVVLAGCGGGGGDGPAAPAAPDIGRDVSALVDFMQALIAGTDETSEPIDIDPLTLAVDNTVDPAPL